MCRAAPIQHYGWCEGCDGEKCGGDCPQARQPVVSQRIAELEAKLTQAERELGDEKVRAATEYGEMEERLAAAEAELAEVKRELARERGE